MYQAKGKIISITEPQVISERLTKQHLILQTDERYPQPLKFEVVNTYLTLLKNFKENDSVNISFVINGRDYKGKIYNDLKLINIAAIPQNELTNIEPQFNPNKVLKQEINEQPNDLPFILILILSIGNLLNLMI